MSLCKCEDLPEFSLLASYLMTPKSSFEPALKVCDESSSELARINATNRHYTRFWFCDEGSGGTVQMCRFARALKSHFLAQMVI